MSFTVEKNNEIVEKKLTHSSKGDIVKIFISYDYSDKRLSELNLENVISKIQANITTSKYTSSNGLSKTEVREENDYSSYNITKDGFIEENWLSTSTTISQIIEITDSYTILDCVIPDEKSFSIEKRKFPIDYIQNELIKPGHIIMIKVYQRPGKIVFEFQDGANLGYEKYFDFDSDDLNDDIFGSRLR